MSKRHERYKLTSRKSRAGESDSGSLVSLPDRAARRKSRGQTSTHGERGESRDSASGPARASSADHGTVPENPQDSKSKVRGHAAPIDGDQSNVHQTGSEGSEPKGKSPPNWFADGGADADGVPSQPGTSKNSNVLSGATDARAGEPKLDRPTEAHSAPADNRLKQNLSATSVSVSYTHLTLPTICSV